MRTSVGEGKRGSKHEEDDENEETDIGEEAMGER